MYFFSSIDIVNGCAAWSLFFSIVSFTFQSRTKILLNLAIASFAYGVHFVLLTQYTAGFLIFLTAFRYLLAAYYPGKRTLLLFFIIMAVSSLGFQALSAVSVVAVIANIAGVYASFKEDEIELRSGLLFPTLCWLGIAFFLKSPFAIAQEFFLLVVNLYILQKLSNSSGENLRSVLIQECCLLKKV